MCHQKGLISAKSLKSLYPFMSLYQAAPRSDRTQTTPIFIIKSVIYLSFFLKTRGKKGMQDIIEKHKEAATNTKYPMFLLFLVCPPVCYQERNGKCQN